MWWKLWLWWHGGWRKLWYVLVKCHILVCCWCSKLFSINIKSQYFNSQYCLLYIFIYYTPLQRFLCNYTYTSIHTYTHTYICPYTHTHTHTHTLIFWLMTSIIFLSFVFWLSSNSYLLTSNSKVYSTNFLFFLFDFWFSHFPSKSFHSRLSIISLSFDSDFSLLP